MSYIDFLALKKRVSMEQAVQLLGLQLASSNGQLRGPCPQCQTGGERALVITPAKGLFFCFAKKSGGDVIALTAHIRGVGNKEAADELDKHFGAVQNGTGASTGTGTVCKPRATPAASQNAGLQPLAYLEAEHEKAQVLGISEGVLKLFEAGYAPKGVLRGRLAVPVKARDGTLLAYCGIAVEKEQSPRLLFHNFDPHNALFNSERVASSGDLWICRDPLQVLQAVENGIPPECVVSVLTDGITPAQLEMLSSLMDEKQIEQAQLL